MPLSAPPTGPLDYNRCTSTEIRTFVRNRSSLNPSDSEELVHYGKTHLIARLEMLDKYSRFRFLDLPPELRLEVYQYILVARSRDAVGDADLAIETSLLRTCKLIYKEAEPVLYGENEITVSISLASKPWSSLYTCSLIREPYWKGQHCIGMVHPACPITNNYHSDRDTIYGPLAAHMASCPCFDVLRRIRHLTLFSGSCGPGTSKELAALCMILSGASRLTKLTIVLGEQWRKKFKIKNLAATFWSVTLLRGEVQLEVQSEVKAVEAKLAEGYDTLYDMLEEYWDLLRTKPYHGLKAPGDLISEARKQEARLAKGDRAHWRYLRHIKRMLSDLLSWLSMPQAVDTFYVHTQVWAALQNYVNEEDE